MSQGACEESAFALSPGQNHDANEPDAESGVCPGLEFIGSVGHRRLRHDGCSNHDAASLFLALQVPRVRAGLNAKMSNEH